jgi:hypothetical protein
VGPQYTGPEPLREYDCSYTKLSSNRYTYCRQRAPSAHVCLHSVKRRSICCLHLLALPAKCTQQQPTTTACHTCHLKIKRRKSPRERGNASCFLRPSSIHVRPVLSQATLTERKAIHEPHVNDGFCDTRAIQLYLVHCRSPPSPHDGLRQYQQMVDYKCQLNVTRWTLNGLKSSIPISL